MVREDYYVVLDHGGIKTAKWFESKDDFDKWYTPFKDIEKIVAQGITAKQAVEMSDCIDNNSRFADSIIELDKK